MTANPHLIMNRRTFINSSLLAGVAVSLSGLSPDILSTRQKTTLIGIGGSGIGLIGKAKKKFGHKANYIGIDTKGEWNANEHHLIDIDYPRPAKCYLPRRGYVTFYDDDSSIEQDWTDNYRLLETVFETKGKVIVLASMFKTMGGIIGDRILREIIKRKKSELFFFSLAPFSFEGRATGLAKEHERALKTGNMVSYFEMLSNAELVKPFNGQLAEGFARVDEKILKRIAQFI